VVEVYAIYIGYKICRCVGYQSKHSIIRAKHIFGITSWILFLLQIRAILKKVTEVEVCEIFLTQAEFGLL